VKYKVATGVAELPGALTTASQHDVVTPDANAVARNAVMGSEKQAFAKQNVIDQLGWVSKELPLSSAHFTANMIDHAYSKIM